ncbi:tRNA pseudouridine(55) synthase TruB [Miniphocaeibacter massiliensis]|uniref:tRNA pseudouridine(55) synthase TruB n=1 Tax=Miniphocaeibacter massiliensis TaxID=2041841 RepID=UPI000C081455|nr:tRNA pseudouridine(55) synthase TruB [Miniphocaeibacter massiliensis]
MSGNDFNGVINVFKEPGYTSHDVVAILRKVLKTKKIGHAGTLDPNVSGVLPICIGKATKISQYLMEYGKTYIAEITFGIETDTEDIWGNIIKTSDIEVNIESFKKSITKFNGKTINQVPPMYSAVKVNGKKLYELARKGEIIERKPRKANIYKLKILKILNNKVIIKVTCSKGTYIRTLIKDICEKSGTIGTMSSLIRVNSGGLDINDSLTIQQIKDLIDKKIYDFIKPIDKSLQKINKYILPEKYFKKVINGVKIKINDDISNETVLVYCKDEFIGIGEFVLLDDIKFLKITNMFWNSNENN